jgi:ribonucleoside-diphosphate reductase alpha chain
MPVSLNAQRTKVFLDRYAKKGPDGQPVESTPEEMWDRVAAEIGEDSLQSSRFRAILENFKFVPGGRILAGAGANSEVTYYNCYVIPVETRSHREARKNDKVTIEKGRDSREAIFDTIGVMVDIMSRGGGVGINWSVLRPKGAYLKRINGTSSGPIGWMDVASKAVGEVEQGGSRRGAAMFMIDDWHPNVIDFIEAKRDLTKITNANVSVAVSDHFMAQVKSDGKWDLCFPDTAHPAYDEEWDGDIAKWRANGYPVKVYATVKAREIWRKIAEAAWDNGEPGIVFLDRYNKESTGAAVERIICVNPCGEQGLGAYSVCNLGAMNLAAYVRHSAEGSVFDWNNFSQDIGTAVEFLDKVVDKNYYFLPDNEDIQKKLRRIGLGVMGLADAMISLGIRYGSSEAVTFTSRVFQLMKIEAISKSAKLAGQLGAAPAWKNNMLQRLYLSELPYEIHREIVANGLRNIFLLTQAPTGTTSILAGVNSGIEPYFAFEYTRVDRTGTHKVYAPPAENWREINSDKPFPPYFVTSNDVTVEEHIAVQAAAQKHIDSSVSKTINAPNSHTIEDVEKAYTLAYDSGLKGVAYFRDGCGRTQVLYKEEPKKPTEVTAPKSWTRPAVLDGKTTKVSTNAGTAYLTVNSDEGRPVEVFVAIGKAGSDVMELGEALGRLVSLSLQQGATLKQVGSQLLGVGGFGKFAKAIPHAIGEALLASSEDGATVEAVDAAPEPAKQVSADLCTECGNTSLVREEGCMKCLSCGWSAC